MALLYLFWNVKTERSVDILNLNRKVIWISKCSEYKHYWVLINSSWICPEFALDVSHIDLLDRCVRYRFVRNRINRYRFRFLKCKYKFLPSKFGSLRRLQYKSWRRFQGMSLRLLQDFSWKHFRDVLKTSWRCLEVVYNVTITYLLIYLEGV